MGIEDAEKAYRTQTNDSLDKSTAGRPGSSSRVFLIAFVKQNSRCSRCEKRPWQKPWELIENSQRRRAEEQALENAMAKLEKTVEQRTAELQDANRKLTLEIAERKRAEDELRTSREQLRGLAGYLQSALVRLRSADGILKSCQLEIQGHSRIVLGSLPV